MCEQGPKIKFCSCAESELAVPFWKLYRPTIDYKAPIIMGVFLPPSQRRNSDSSETQFHETLTEALETKDSFDFDYSPKPGDIFELHTSDKTMVFTAEECLIVKKDSQVPQWHIGWSYTDSRRVDKNSNLQNIAHGSIETAEL